MSKSKKSKKFNTTFIILMVIIIIIVIGILLYFILSKAEHYVEGFVEKKKQGKGVGMLCNDTSQCQKHLKCKEGKGSTGQKKGSTGQKKGSTNAKVCTEDRITCMKADMVWRPDVINQEMCIKEKGYWGYYQNELEHPSTIEEIIENPSLELKCYKEPEHIKEKTLPSDPTGHEGEKCISRYQKCMYKEGMWDEEEKTCDIEAGKKIARQETEVQKAKIEKAKKECTGHGHWDSDSSVCTVKPSAQTLKSTPTTALQDLLKTHLLRTCEFKKDCKFGKFTTNCIKGFKQDSTEEAKFGKCQQPCETDAACKKGSKKLGYCNTWDTWDRASLRRCVPFKDTSCEKNTQCRTNQCKEKTCYCKNQQDCNSWHRCINNKCIEPCLPGKVHTGDESIFNDTAASQAFFGEKCISDDHASVFNDDFDTKRGCSFLGGDWVKDVTKKPIQYKCVKKTST